MASENSANKMPFRKNNQFNYAKEKRIARTANVHKLEKNLWFDIQVNFNVLSFDIDFILDFHFACEFFNLNV